MRGAVTALLLLPPSLACAEGFPDREYSFLSSFIQMIAALSLVIGLILLTRHFSGKLLKSGATGRFGATHIRLVETRALSPKNSLVLVEVGGEYLLLASTESGVRLLKQVELFEEIEVVDDDGRGRTELFGMFRRQRGKGKG